MKARSMTLTRTIRVGLAAQVLLAALVTANPSAALSAGPGKMVAWGNNAYGQVSNLPSEPVYTAISAGGTIDLALKSDGTVVVWGDNTVGQVSNRPTEPGYTAIAAGHHHALALKSNGTVVAWGSNFYGESSVPAGLSGVVAIAAGFYRSLALQGDGTVVVFGNNTFGQVSNRPTEPGYTAIAAGCAHDLALKSDGTVVAWGRNTEGQTNVPAGLSGVVAIAAGDSHSLALKSDGTVVAWGRNVNGESSVPAELSGVIAIDAGSFHSLALVDGTPPIITANIAGTLGSNGWYVGDVTVSWSTVDDGSAITSSSGCDPTTVNTDTAGITLTCTATSTGGTANQSVTIKRDASAPTTDGSSSVTGQQATVTLSASDAGSGVASTSYRLDGGSPQNYSGPFTVTGTGAHTVTFFSVDVAGNSEAERSTSFDITLPTPTATNTPTNTPTSTATPTATSPAPSFPAHGVLDSFNRANGGVGGNWQGLTGTSFYKIAGNRLDVQLGGSLVWKNATLGTSQEAFVTLSTIDRTGPSQGLLLKVQTGNFPNAGAIAVVYDALAKAVRVSTLRLNDPTWTLYTSTPVTFANGDQLGARALANGRVEIYKNGVMITTVTLNAADQAFFNGKGGKIGLWTVAASNAVFDDFGGGPATP